MGETIKIRNITFGAGIPKICVPIPGRTQEEILQTARETGLWNCDAVEWRADLYEDHLSMESFRDMFQKLSKEFRASSPEKITLFTVRTASDGGAEIPRKDYMRMNLYAAGKADLIDIEFRAGETVARDFVKKAQGAGSNVVVSYHDFSETPPEEELVTLMRNMQETGADLVKVAVMPQTEEDVDRLMSATRRMKENYARVPLITMSMGAIGRRSRVRGESFGSVMTFASVKEASAPGQIELEQLRRELTEFHKVLTVLGPLRGYE